VNENGGVNGADVISSSGGHGSVGGIAEDDGVDLGWIVFLVGIRGSPGCGAGRTVSARAEMRMSGVTQGVENQGECTDGSHGGEQDGSWGERLAAGDIEAGSGESGVAGLEGLLHRWMILKWPCFENPYVSNH
jgi:hypothetical protein